MSEAESQANSILLPSSSVAIFSKDPDTLEAAKKLPDDWRYARVDMMVEETEVVGATKSLGGMNSPDVVILQTDVIDDGFTGQLEELANNCDEGTAAIVIGPDNDVNLYRKLIDMGVSDYLVRPVTEEMLSSVVARTLIERKGISESRLIGFLGAKGGVGTSSVVRASAWCSSDLMRQKTIVLDASGGWSTMSVGLGFEPTTTLPEAIKALLSNDDDSFDRMIFDAGNNLDVLATGSDIMLESSIDPAQIEMLIDHLMVKYPVVLVDLSCAPIALAKAVIAQAHQVQIVTSANLVSLRLARSLVHEINELHGGESEVVELMVNMCGQNPDMEVSKGDIASAMEIEVSSLIPYAPKVFVSAESESRKITGQKEGQELVQNKLRPVLSKVLEDKGASAPVEAARSGLLGGLLNKAK